MKVTLHEQQIDGSRNSNEGMVIRVKKIEAEDLYRPIRDWVISADQVAHVQIGNPLEHALLVLIKTGYSAIPVLDASYKLKGLISKTLILDFALGLERIEFEKLEVHHVEEVMRTDIPSVKESDSILTAIKLLIDHTFLCIVDDDGYFGGILTRSAVLKFLNHYLREISKESVSQK